VTELDEHIDYENRVLLYCDFLGWKDAVKRSVNDTGVRDSLGDILRETRHAQDLIQRVKESGRQSPLGMESAHISDTVLFSCPGTPEGTNFIFRQAADLVCRFLAGNVPLLCRGAVVSGLLYHRDNSVFGPALDYAAELESKRAIYPRFLLGEDLVNDCKKNHLLVRDADGVPSLDVFRLIIQRYDARFCHVWLCEARKSICGQLNRDVDSRAKSKWSYMAQRFNAALSLLPPDARSGLEPIPQALMEVALS
jgi:hypothetical protein